uniref:DUF4220 domain-containing protein n=1 Tax=Leersia perrieri TaxID=77586 RepID=A0A0D9WTV1_9ORYZ
MAVGGYRQKLIQLWNDWQVTTLVLLSFSLQLLFLATAGARRRAQPTWWKRTYFWALYIGSRFIATYSLGILSTLSTGDAETDIQAFWACLLLFHLGGPDDFAALTLEDNKLWDRRCLELVIQISTTVYVFVRYFPDDEFRRFIAPFALVFAAGVVKCVEQVAALRHATMEKLIESVLGKPDAGPDYADTMNRLDGIMRSGALPSLDIKNERVDRPNSGEYSLDPEANEPEGADYSEDEHVAIKTIRSAHALFSRFSVLFADGIFSFKDRQESQSMFFRKDAKWAFKVVEIELSFVYDRLYTKSSISRRTRLIIRICSLLLTLSASLLASLVMILHKSQYQQRHRCVTYALLAGAVINDVILLAGHVFSIESVVNSDWLNWCSIMFVKRRRWSDQMAQSNLITFCLRKLPCESDPWIASVCRRIRGNGGSRRGGQQVAALPYPAAAISTLAGEIRASDELQKLFERRSLEDQVCSGSFWRTYKQTKHVVVSKKLKDFIFEQLEEKERCLNKWEVERERRLELERKRKNGSGRNSPAPASAAPAPDSVSRSQHKTTTMYKALIGCRGDRVMKSEGIDGLRWSLEDREFDESLLIWHIATDLRFREEQPAVSVTAETRKHMEIARELSNYLYYIMVVHPLMLSSSTTMAIKRCRDTCAEARRLFLKDQIMATNAGGKGSSHRRRRHRNRAIVSEDNAYEVMFKVETPLHAAVVKGDRSKSVLWDGCSLAKQLRQISGGDESERDRGKEWRVVCKVWVEMLCFAAVHCGGYHHAERLKDGGELITFVCLLMTHLGMGKHYKTEVGDAYAHLSAYSAA